jgi:hypothetical protein
MLTVTTEEAKTKRCVQHPFDDTRSCLHSHCMAWRWAYFTLEHEEHGPNHDADGGGPAFGYCGLAGPIQ